MSTSTSTFSSTSDDVPTILHVSFAKDPTGSLGTVLSHCDKGMDAELFLPGYAVVNKILPGETVAKTAGVQVGDCIIAINGKGFRRFAPDYNTQDVKVIGNHVDDEKEGEGGAVLPLDSATAVVAPGNAYDNLLQEIKAIKSNGGDPPLHLTFERYGWDARPNAWGRFLDARDGNVPAALQLIQQHEAWRATTFPIDLNSPGLQAILKEKAVSEIDVEFLHNEAFPPTVYVDYGKLLSMQTAGTITSDDVVSAFLIFTERLLAKANDPRHPKTCQFIDLSGVSITSGFRVDTLKKIYSVFEPNYPETLYKMVIYPVSTLMRATARTLLSFINAKTQKKFLITSSLDEVCTDLGWNKAEVEECGGIQEFMHKHEKVGTTLLQS